MVYWCPSNTLTLGSRFTLLVSNRTHGFSVAPLSYFALWLSPLHKLFDIQLYLYWSLALWRLRGSSLARLINPVLIVDLRALLLVSVEILSLAMLLEQLRLERKLFPEVLVRLLDP